MKSKKKKGLIIGLAGIAVVTAGIVLTGGLGGALIGAGALASGKGIKDIYDGYKGKIR